MYTPSFSLVWRELLLSVVQAIIATNTVCNSRCITCNYWRKGSRSIQLSRAEIEDAVDQLHEVGVDQIMISGGEPLTHPNLFEVLHYIKRKGIRIVLNTNGILLAKYMDDVARTGDILVVSMDASSPELYARIRGTNRFHQIVSAVRVMRSQHPQARVDLRCTLQRHNLLDVFSIAQLANDLHCRLGFNPVDAVSDNFLRESRPGGIGNNSDNVAFDDLIPTLDEIDEFVALLDTQDVLDDPMSVSISATWTKTKFLRLAEYFRGLRQNRPRQQAGSPCIVPYTSILIEANGDVKRCFYDKPSGNISEGKLTTFCSESEVEKGIDVLRGSGKCHNCRTRLFS